MLDTISTGQHRLPGGHPPALLGVIVSLAIDDRLVEEARGQARQTAMGAEGVAEGRERLAQVIGRTPTDADARAIHAANRRAPRPPDRFAMIKFHLPPEAETGPSHTSIPPTGKRAVKTLPFLYLLLTDSSAH